MAVHRLVIGGDDHDHGGSDRYASDGNSDVGSQTWFQFLML